MTKHFLFIFIIISYSVQCFSQTGPGGVGTTDGSSELELWFDSRDVNGDGTNPAASDNVVTWVDKSGNVRNVTQNKGNVAFYANPGVTFNNIGYLLGDDAGLPTGDASRTLFIVASTPSIGTDDIMFAYGREAVNNTFAVSSNDNGVGRDGNVGMIFYGNDVDDAGVGGWFPAGTTKVVGTKYITGGTREIYVDGTQIQDFTSTNTNTILSDSLQIGGWNTFDLNSSATIYEILFYSKELNGAEQIIVENYLAAKNGEDLADNDVYDEDDNGDFDYDVAGIGRVDASNLHEEAQGTGIVRVLNPTGLGDNEFFMWGHDNGALAVNESADVPTGVEARFERVWRVSEVDISGSAVDVGSIDIRWDLTGISSITENDLRLLIDTDNDGSFADETPISGATYLGDNIYEFAGVSAIANNHRFTLGSVLAKSGPGGVGMASGNDMLELWFHSRDINGDGTNPAVNANVETWADKSGNGRNVTQNKSNVAYYDGSGVKFNNIGYLLGDDAGLPTGDDSRTLFIVASTPSVGTDDIMFAYGREAVNNTFAVSSNDNGVDRDGNVGMIFYGNDVDDGGVGGWFPEETTKIVGTKYITGGTREIYVDGDQIFTTNAATTNTILSDSLQIGGWNTFDLNSSATFYEILFYSKALNSAEQIIVENYLASTHGTHLTENNVYDEYKDVNGNFDSDVAGIGRVDAANIHDDAQGTGIIRVSAPTDLDDDEFLIWGHDDGELVATEKSDVPLGMEARLGRVWRVSEASSTGSSVDVGGVDIRFDLTGLGEVQLSGMSAPDLRLLVDSNGDGVFADETPIAGATLVGGNIYQFSGVTAIEDNFRFTLGTADLVLTPLPVTLINFEAALLENNTVQLDWETGTEIGNDYFSIERSAEGRHWAELDQVEGAGNSTDLVSYSFYDDQPLSGTSYYRLKQVDFSGEFFYSKVVSVRREVGVKSEVIVYPNPTMGEVMIEGSPSELEYLTVYNAFGADITHLISIEMTSEAKAVVDLSQLQAGFYFLKNKTVSTKVWKR
ncbi:T9SS type A sorting domain-containing protein [Flammeovirgaceae bacterium SG7u.111]|nr:T9SS type A sorting domain-containing protein [Flammeovirgaceae bacterium SG7u.132]WPO36539.1 T9SS type A sorting domain-containing protein [Flammeovirgaceae bacterium SG7u.111]